MCTKMWFAIRSFLLGVLSCFLVVESAMVTISSGGTIHGREEDTAYGKVNVYLGIPYAAPPTAALRLMPPQPPAEISQYNATYHRPYCLQNPAQTVSFPAEVRQAGMDEDCLHLNVYVPASVQPETAVMVWIHGGAFNTGTGSIYDARYLAAIGKVIVVTFNYRLGVLGFFPSKGTEGTLGLQDQIQALQWVQANIKSFGGDQKQVTIFGESAGAASVSLLTVSPKAEGLFKGAISQSGVLQCPWVIGDSMERSVKAEEILLRFGCNDPLIDCVKKATPSQIVNITNHMNWTPLYVDNDVIPQNYKDMSTLHKDLLLLVGVNTDESAFSVYMQCTNMYTQSCNIQQGLSTEQLKAFAHVPYDIRPDQLENLVGWYNTWYPYQLMTHGNANLRAASQLGSDYSFRIPANISATTMTKAGVKVYLYEFNLKGSMKIFPGVPWSKDAMHGDEIPFVFAWQTGKESDEEIMFGQIVAKAWAEFAKGKMNADWMPFTIERGEHMLIDKMTPSGRVQPHFFPLMKDGVWKSYKKYGMVPPPPTIISSASDMFVPRILLLLVAIRCLLSVLYE